MRIFAVTFTLIIAASKSSGFNEPDGLLVQQWETKKFKPALIDGVPIRALYRAGGQTPRL